MCHKYVNGEIAHIRWSLGGHNFKLLLNLERDCKVFFDKKLRYFINNQSKKN